MITKATHPSDNRNYLITARLLYTMKSENDELIKTLKPKVDDVIARRFAGYEDEGAYEEIAIKSFDLIGGDITMNFAMVVEETVQALNVDNAMRIFDSGYMEIGTKGIGNMKQDGYEIIKVELIEGKVDAT